MALRARKGIPHLGPVITPKGNKAPTLNEEEYQSLWENGKLIVECVTEKTDGMAWIVGYDSLGFFTKHSGSGDFKIRGNFGHTKLASAKGSKSLYSFGAMDNFHRALADNQKLLSYLISRFDGTRDVIIRGEAMINLLATWDDETITYNRIPYLRSKVRGAIGMFVIHSQLEDNLDHDLDVLKMCTDEHVFYDTDVYNCGKIIIHEPSPWLNLPFDFHKHMTATSLYNHLEQVVKPKWGDVREGVVIHPSNAHQPRFKIISQEFQNAQRSWK